MNGKQIEVKDVSYIYEEAPAPALNHVQLSADRGEFLAVLGHNGSGKSTLAKLLNALYLPEDGTVLICGMDTKDDEHLWDIRQSAGMIFQNPDNQIVATVVREDVAFGLENMGVPHDEMVQRIDKALASVRMTKYAESSPHMLSGGQKQRVAIAGVLAMQPKIIIADESTSMLDPSGREEVLSTIRRLNRENGITVIWITHYMEEAALADRVIVISDGEICMSGTPREVFSRGDELRKLHLDVPHMTHMAEELRQAGMPVDPQVLTVDEMVQEVLKQLCPSS